MKALKKSLMKRTSFNEWINLRELVRPTCASGPQIDDVAHRISLARNPYRWPW